MNELIWLALLFIIVSGATFTLVQWVTWRRHQLQERLRIQAGGETDSSPEFILGELTPALAGQFPIRGDKQTQIQQELREAGIYRPTAVMEYAAVRAALILLPLVLAGVLAALAEEVWIPRILLGGLVLALLGYSIPRIYLNHLARERKRKIEKGLPVAVDLLSLGLLGGQNIIAALRRVSHEMHFSFPELAQELAIVREQAQLNTLPHALQQWADRSRIPEVRNLTVILTQSERLGTDVCTSLFEFSNNFRTNLRQRADAQASRASFWMLFPSIFFLWLPAVVLLMGPLYFEFFNKRNQAREAVQQSQARSRMLGGVGAGQDGTPAQGTVSGP